MIYGNVYLNEAYNNSDYNLLEDTISYALDSYNNYKSLLEQCTDEKDKAILEAKCEVLYEVSIKDIGIWIRKAIDRIIQILKDGWNKIREFFKSKKTKMMEEEIKELKKDIQKAKAEKKGCV